MERNAKTELWFYLLILGDENPIINQSSVNGILFVNSRLNQFFIIEKFKEFLDKEPSFFQYINKIVPIERVIESNVSLIEAKVDELLKEKPEFMNLKSFCIIIRKRKTQISRSSIIESIAPKINLSVDLKNPEWIIWIEIIGKITGISILKPTQVLSIKKLKNKMYNFDEFDDFTQI